MGMAAAEPSLNPVLPPTDEQGSRVVFTLPRQRLVLRAERERRRPPGPMPLAEKAPAAVGRSRRPPSASPAAVERSRPFPSNRAVRTPNLSSVSSRVVRGDVATEYGVPPAAKVFAPPVAPLGYGTKPEAAVPSSNPLRQPCLQPRTRVVRRGEPETTTSAAPLMPVLPTADDDDDDDDGCRSPSASVHARFVQREVVRAGGGVGERWGGVLGFVATCERLTERREGRTFSWRSTGNTYLNHSIFQIKP